MAAEKQNLYFPPLLTVIDPSVPAALVTHSVALHQHYHALQNSINDFEFEQGKLLEQPRGGEDVTKYLDCYYKFQKRFVNGCNDQNRRISYLLNGLTSFYLNRIRLLEERINSYESVVHNYERKRKETINSRKRKLFEKEIESLTAPPPEDVEHGINSEE